MIRSECRQSLQTLLSHWATMFVSVSVCLSVCDVSIAAAPGSELAPCQLHSQARIFSVPDSLTAACQRWMLRNRENVLASQYSRCDFATQARLNQLCCAGYLWNRLSRWRHKSECMSLLRCQRFNHFFHKAIKQKLFW